MYQDADIYLLDDPFSAVDAGVSRHLFEQGVCSCVSIISAFQEPCRDQRRELRKAFVLQEIQLILPWCPSPRLFLPQKIHYREILYLHEVKKGQYSRCFHCVETSGVRALQSEG